MRPRNQLAGNHFVGFMVSQSLMNLLTMSFTLSRIARASLRPTVPSFGSDAAVGLAAASSESRHGQCAAAITPTQSCARGHSYGPVHGRRSPFVSALVGRRSQVVSHDRQEGRAPGRGVFRCELCQLRESGPRRAFTSVNILCTLLGVVLEEFAANT